jgi:hypothetical protein
MLVVLVLLPRLAVVPHSNQVLAGLFVELNVCEFNLALEEVTFVAPKVVAIRLVLNCPPTFTVTESEAESLEFEQLIRKVVVLKRLPVLKLPEVPRFPDQLLVPSDAKQELALFEFQRIIVLPPLLMLRLSAFRETLTLRKLLLLSTLTVTESVSEPF